MKSILKYLIFNVFFLTCSYAQHKTSKFTPGELWLDNNGVHINAHGGGVLIFNDTYYWFGEHKVQGGSGNKAMVGIHVYKSKDLYNWTDEGIALKMLKDKNSMLQKGSVVERPKVIFNKKTNKFVMWFHHELKDQGYKAALTGVAVADNVTGPYKYINSFRIHPNKLPINISRDEFSNIEAINNSEGEDWKLKTVKGAYFKRDFEVGQMSRDMTLFVDNDETAYHITAAEENQTLLISKLSEDYLSLTDEYVRVFPGGRNEAPAIFKKDDKYYMFSSGLTGWSPNPGRVSVSSNMMGEWKFLGNPCRGTEKQNNTTFESQSTYILPVIGKKDAFIFMADRWRPKNAIDGRYIWLPVQFEKGMPILKWYDQWDLSFFDN